MGCGDLREGGGLGEGGGLRLVVGEGKSELGLGEVLGVTGVVVPDSDSEVDDSDWF
jgi:hypothetical protein